LGFTRAARAMLEKASLAVGLPIRHSLERVDGLLPPEYEVSLFRILQEALNNIVKHAQATLAEISWQVADAHLHLVIRDNGRGFDPALLDSAAGLGLRQMAERVRIMGGHFDVESAPGQGTCLTIAVPLPRPPAAP
jgi:signal transduction histidine kinase